MAYSTLSNKIKCQATSYSKSYSSTTMDDINDTAITIIPWTPNIKNLTIQFGKDVHVSGYGAYGKVRGRISIHKTAITLYWMDQYT